MSGRVRNAARTRRSVFGNRGFDCESHGLDPSLGRCRRTADRPRLPVDVAGAGLSSTPGSQFERTPETSGLGCSAYNTILRAYAREERDALLTEALALWVHRMRGPMSIGALLRMAGLGEGAFIAAVALLEDGRLVAVSPGRIWIRLMVAPPAWARRQAMRAAA